MQLRFDADDSAQANTNTTTERAPTAVRAKKRRSGRRVAQTELFTRSWGGARRGAGRKPKGERPLVSHARREELSADHPVHVTTRLLPGLPSLRRSEELRAILRSIRAAQERSGLRVVHYSIQTNHLHLLVEARGRASLSLGIGALLVRIARALNRLWRRTGRLFGDRFHARALRTPLEVRHALVYVLQNARKHGLPLTGVDSCSSGAWFDGWRETRGLRAKLAEIARRLVRLIEGYDSGRPWLREPALEASVSPALERGAATPALERGSANPAPEQGAATPIARARTWLLARGWRRAGEIGHEEVPGARRVQSRA